MPVRPLSRDRILSAALAIADRQGVDKVTMRNVASRLGVEAMSLYNHVPSKQAMLDGLVDRIIQVAQLPSGDITAEQWIRETVRAFRALAQQHPRLLDVLNLRAVPLHDPDSAVPFEAGLRAFARSGYSPKESFAALQAMSIAILSIAQLDAAAALHPDLGQAAETDTSALTSHDFPLLNEVLASPAGLDDFWDMLTETLVRGLRPGPPPKRKRPAS